MKLAPLVRCENRESVLRVDELLCEGFVLGIALEFFPEGDLASGDADFFGGFHTDFDSSVAG